MDTNGFYGDTFSSGFGDFYTAKKRDPFVGLGSYHGETPFSQADKFYSAQPGLSAWGEAKIKVGRLEFIIFTFFCLSYLSLFHRYFKRRMEMDTNGFYGDTFSSGFGDFYTAKRSKSIKKKNLTRKSE